MKYLKLFENINKQYHVVIEMVGGNPEIVHVFENKEDAHNYIILSVHNYEREQVELETDGKSDDYGCKDIFDIDELLEYWNEKHAEDGDDTYYEIVKSVDKVELPEDLKIRMNAKKYNL